MISLFSFSNVKLVMKKYTDRKSLPEFNLRCLDMLSQTEHDSRHYRQFNVMPCHERCSRTIEGTFNHAHQVLSNTPMTSQAVPSLLRFHANQTRSCPSRPKRAKEAYRTGRPFISHLKGGWLVSVDLYYWTGMYAYTSRKLVPLSKTPTRL